MLGARKARIGSAVAVVGLVAGAALAGATVAVAARAAAKPPSPCSEAPGVQLRQVGRYLVTLQVGPVPKMYTAAEAKRLKPKSGVVMLEPMKDLTGGMKMAGGGRRHVRVQVCDARTGKPLRAPRPTIDVAVSMLRQSFPLTRGYDVGTPPSDIRFCQVIVLPKEQAAISVKVGAVIAAFSVAPPGA